jgi:hypothetical protein
MAKEDTENKAKLIIKTFLFANKGKKYTSKEIAHFVNSNPFGLGKYDVTSVAVTRWIKEKKNGFFRHVKMERKDGRNVWHFWVEA